MLTYIPVSFLFSFKKMVRVRVKNRVRVRVSFRVRVRVSFRVRDRQHHRWRSGAHISMTSRIVRINVQCGRKSPVVYQFR